MGAEGKKSAPPENWNWPPQRNWRPSLGGRLAIRFFSILNMLLPWHRLPLLMGVFNLEALQLQLREKNLFYPTLDGQLGALAPEAPPPESAVFRTADGRFNDLRHPLMGAAETRFGRNFAVQPEPEEELLEPSPRVVSRRLLARTDFKPATTLNLLAAAWIQFQVHDWFDHGDPELERRFEIPLESDDPRHSCPMKIKRTRFDPTRTDQENRAGLPPTFINRASHWWDASAIYGSNLDITKQFFAPVKTASCRCRTDGCRSTRQQKLCRQDFRQTGGSDWKSCTPFLHSNIMRSAIGSGSNIRTGKTSSCFRLLGW